MKSAAMRAARPPCNAKPARCTLAARARRLLYPGVMRRRLRSAVLAFAAALLGAAPAAPAAPLRPDRAEVEPAWTSIYVGTVSLRPGAFQRQPDGSFSAPYRARVFPFFPASEEGTIVIQMTDATLDRLTRGEAIEFSGEARNTSGDLRTVSGRATPAGPHGGRLKVRVRVSPRIELIFNTAYRFLPATAAVTPSGT